MIFEPMVLVWPPLVSEQGNQSDVQLLFIEKEFTEFGSSIRFVLHGYPFFLDNKRPPEERRFNLFFDVSLKFLKEASCWDSSYVIEYIRSINNSLIMFLINISMLLENRNQLFHLHPLEK